MSLSIIVNAGWSFPAGVPFTLASLRKAALPTISISGSVGTNDLVPGAVTAAVSTPDAYYYALDTGGANAASITLNPAPAGLADGLLVAFKVANANTGAATLDVGFGPKPVKKYGGTDLAAGDWLPGLIVECRYRLDANIVPAGVNYGGGGAYTLNVVPGATYTWSKNTNDLTLVNGAQTLNTTGDFTAVGTTVTLTGTPAALVTTTVITASNVWEMTSQSARNPQLSDFVGPSSYIDGISGLVPRPHAGQQGYYLRADGKFADAVSAGAALANNQSAALEIFKQQNFS